MPDTLHHGTVKLSLITGLVLENTFIDSGAFTHAISWVFSRPNTLVYGRDGLVREAGRMAESMFSTSRPPVSLENGASGLQSHSGARAMTKVNTTPSPKATPLGTVARQEAIKSARVWRCTTPSPTHEVNGLCLSGNQTMQTINFKPTVNNQPLNTTLNTMALAWRHLDSICVGSGGRERNLVNEAAEYVERVRSALLSEGPIDLMGIIAMLDATTMRLGLASYHLEELIDSMGEATM